MNRICEQDLESYRLAAYARQVACYICDGANTFDAELCRHCFAPMALSQQAKGQKFLPHIAAVLGASGVGKTVYLGMLMDILSRRPGPLQISARGPFSITLQQTTVAALQGCEFPSKTPNEPDQWNWIHCRVQAKGVKPGTELMLPDVAGEAIEQEIEHPQTFPVIRSVLGKCSGIVLLLDSIQLRDGNHAQEHYAMKVLSLLSELNGDRKTGWPTRPVSIVFSKADQTDVCLDDPDAFAREHIPGVFSDCQERFPKTRYFAAGVAGACAFRTEIDRTRRRIPLRVEPRGIIEPFSWIVQSLPKARKAEST
ncbi:MAG: hypothetical protein KDA42_06590 [Planctomycetales bacterium]|nr:hypothetical protein [Planctomycetales bacterium]